MSPLAEIMEDAPHRYRLSAQQKRRWSEGDERGGKIVVYLGLIHDTPIANLQSAVEGTLEQHAIFHCRLDESPSGAPPLQRLALRPSGVWSVDDGGAFYQSEALNIRAETGDGIARSVTLEAPLFYSDAQSTMRLIADLDAALAGVSLGEESDYLQFSEWQSEMLADADDQDRQFWDSLYPPSCESPSPKRQAEPRRVASTRHRRIVISDQEIKTALRERQGSSEPEIEDIFLACWCVLLWRVTAGAQAATGLMCPGRSFEELQSIVGPVERTLPLSVGVGADLSLTELVERVRSARSKLLDHEECFDWGDRRDRRHQFQVLFRHDRLDAALQSLRIEGFEIHETASPLSLQSAQGLGGTNVILSYEPDFHPAPFIDGFAEHYRILVLSSLRQASIRVADMPYMDAASEKRALSVPVLPMPREDGAHLRFAHWAYVAPNSIAVIDDTGSYSYGDIWRQACCLATRLSQHSPGRVGLYLRPSRLIPVAMLAAMKAGHAYVPFEPGAPRERLKNAAQNAAIEVFLTEESLAGDLEFFFGSTVFIDQPLKDGGTSTAAHRGLESAAYVIYTSGTTGTPKGVEIPHRALLNYVDWLSETFGIHAGDGSALVTSYAFDLGYTSLWGTLLNGGRVYIPSEETRARPEHLLHQAHILGLTYLKLTPSLIKLWIHNVGHKALADLSLRLLFLGGEPFNPAPLLPLAKMRPELRLVNHYGPTEATIGAIAYDFPAGELEQFATAPVLGRAIRGTQAFILDNNDRVVPAGVIGELCLAGQGIALGYIGASVSAHRAFCQPSRQFPERMYRTGDLARQNYDGLIEFHGRVDRQVKIRGHRVELDEIESALADHPGVARAAVQLSDGGLSARVAPDGQARQLKRLCRIATSKSLHWTALANGRPVFELNRLETNYQFHELFENQDYFRHGARTDPGDTVLDLGANIGLFALSLKWRQPTLRIVSLEPARAAFQCLQANAELYPEHWTVLQAATGKSQGAMLFTEYPEQSLLSGLYPDPKSDRTMLKTLSRIETISDEDRTTDHELDQTIRDLMKPVHHECRVETVSSIIRAQGMERVDLLKIDVQRSECDVLDGIEEADWGRIRQIVIEAHGTAGVIERIVGSLTKRGFQVEVDREPFDRRLIFARAPWADSRPVVSAQSSADQRPEKQPGQDECLSPQAFAQSLQSYLRLHLPDFMIPSSFSLVADIPLDANGKIDRKAWWKQVDLPTVPRTTPLRTRFERTVGEAWKVALETDEVFLESNFFDLGGDSLKSAVLANHLGALADVEVVMIDALRNPGFADFVSLLKTRSQAIDGAGLASRVFETVEEPGSEGMETPLLPMQRRLWVLSQMQAAHVAYNMARDFKIRGELSVSALEKALRTLVARHEAVRTVFRPGESTHQCALPVAEAWSRLQFDEVDCRPAQDDGTRAHGLILAEARRPFDLQNELPLRARLVRIGDQEWHVLLTAHHLVCDGWSMEVLTEELFHLYAAHLQGLAIDSTPQYSYAKTVLAIQRATAAGAHEAKRHWIHRLEGLRIEPDLPLDFPRGEEPTFEGAIHDVHIESTTRRALDSLARTQRTTLFSLSAAIVVALLHRWAGRSDVSLGVTVSGREEGRLDPCVGLFSNSIVLREQVNGGESFEQLSRRITDRLLGDLKHPAMALDDSLGTLKVSRRGGIATLFDVGLTWYVIGRNADLRALGEAAALEIEELEPVSPPARSDLWFFVLDLGGSLKWRLIYNKALFSPESVKSLAALLCGLTQEVVRSPNTHISDFALLPSPAKEQQANLTFELNF